VSWNKKNRKWKTQIKHGGKNQFLGYFNDEQEAARAVDTAARLRGEDAHGGRAGNGIVLYVSIGEKPRTVGCLGSPPP